MANQGENPGKPKLPAISTTHMPSIPATQHHPTTSIINNQHFIININRHHNAKSSWSCNNTPWVHLCKILRPPPAKHLLRLAHGENLGMDAACCCNKRYSKMYLLVVWKSYTSKPKHTLSKYEYIYLWTYANHSVQTHWTMFWYTVYCRDIHILYSSFLYRFCSQNLSMYPCTSWFGSGANLCCRQEWYCRGGNPGGNESGKWYVMQWTVFFGKFMVEMSAPRLGTNLHWNI